MTPLLQRRAHDRPCGPTRVDHRLGAVSPRSDGGVRERVGRVEQRVAGLGQHLAGLHVLTTAPPTARSPCCMLVEDLLDRVLQVPVDGQLDRLPGWAGCASWYPPGICGVQRRRCRPRTSARRPTPRAVVVALLEPAQARVVAGVPDQVGRQVMARHYPGLVAADPDTGQVQRGHLLRVGDLDPPGQVLEPLGGRRRAGSCGAAASARRPARRAGRAGSAVADPVGRSRLTTRRVGEDVPGLDACASTLPPRS